MWTHLQPLLDALLTRGSIERRARVGLCRALNIHRLIMMAGSGLSRPLGFPAWNEFAAIYVALTKKQYVRAEAHSKRGQPLDARTSHHLRQLRKLCSDADPDGPTVPAPFPVLDARRVDALGNDADAIVEVCDELLRLLGTDPSDGLPYLHHARAEFADLFRTGGDDMAKARLRALFARMPTIPSEVEASSDGRDHFVRVLARIVCPSVTRKLLDAVTVAPEDVLSIAVKRRATSRILSLNYDLEIERHLGDSKAITGDAVDFALLCDRKTPDRPIPRKVTVQDGMRRALVTTTLDRSNVGDLINFGAYSLVYDYQIFHLHGRPDDPPNMVVTQNDYRRIYMQSGEAEDIFEEAREVVFGGNDILFAGIGLKEEDVLRPFRRFIGREGRAALGRYKVFALMPRGVASFVAGHDLGDGSDPTATEKAEKLRTEADRAAISKDTLASIKRAETYGILTIHYGGVAYVAARRALGAADAFLKFGDVTAAAVRRELDIADLASRGAAADGSRRPPMISKPERELIDCVLKLTASASDTQKIAAKALVAEIETRVFSRALVQEFRDLRRDSGLWWDAWRQPPGERRASASRISADVSGSGPADGDYLWARHCPDEEPISPVALPLVAWRPVQQAWDAGAAVAAAWRYDNKKALAEGRAPVRRRILRLAMPRGGGAGSFVRLILHRESHGRLFASAAGSPIPSYAGAFVAHLAYSLEFTSVIGALTRFVAHQAAKLQLAELKAAAAGRADLLEHMKAGRPQSIPPQVENEIASGGFETYFIRSREREPRLLDHRDLVSEAELPPEVRRPHRLELLKRTLTIHANLTLRADEFDAEQRILIVLSGLDQICDANGDAFSPVHRAFFRMLVGAGRSNTEVVDGPWDIVLGSGRPDVPICYLSDEVAADAPDVDRNTISHLSSTRRNLVKWMRLSPFDWFERLHLTSIRALFLGRYSDELQSESTALKHEPLAAFDVLEWLRKKTTDLGRIPNGLPESHRDIAGRALRFLAWVEQAEVAHLRDASRSHPQRTLIRLLWDNLALSNWVLVAWVGLAKHDEAIPEAQAFSEFVADLDRAAGRDGMRGILDFVIAVHRKAEWRRMIQPIRPGALDDGEPADPRAMDVLLSHLALFTIPIEPIVLLDCPLVSKALGDVLEDRADRSMPVDVDEKERATRRSDARADRRSKMCLLLTLLNRLTERGFAVPVQAATDTGAAVCDGCDPIEIPCHRRYSLHSRLREHLTRKMRLSVPDRGDRTHYQMSLYCDQPKDLPTPSAEHFHMVEGIISAHIDHCRDSIGPAYRFSRQGSRLLRDESDQLPDLVAGSRQRDAAMIFDAIFYRPGDPSNLSKAHDRIHGLSHRLRGVYSLLRGGFSVGAISRLDIASERDVDFDGRVDSPFDTYSHWLRSLLSIAVGIDINGVEISSALKGELAALVTHVPVRTASSDEVDKFFARLGPFFGETLSDRERDRQLEALRSIKDVVDEFRRDGVPLEARMSRHTKLRNPFYRDEIAWIYNERGVTALIQGKIFDALPLFERALFVVAHKVETRDEDTHAHHSVERRILLNAAIAEIEHGKIETARASLIRLDRTSAHAPGSTPSQTQAFARAYLALCDHLSGSLEIAKSGYETAIAIFNERRQLRAVSIFCRHYADLLRRNGDFDGAKRRADLAISAASQVEQRDIFHMAQVARADIALAQNEPADAQERLTLALAYAEKMNLFRLQVSALLTRAHVLLERGEISRAGRTAAEAVGVAVRNGLGLRKLHGLELLAEIQQRRGASELARTILLETKSEAERLHYQTRSSKAAARLSGLDHPTAK